MIQKTSRYSAHTWRIIFGLAALMCLLTVSQSAYAIPAFSRKYATSCITCHAGFPKLNAAGEAFRRNGYQFPSDDEFLVKDEPVPLGNDRYKEMWPNSLWPNDIPHLPPLAIRTRMGFNQYLNDKSGGEQTSDFQFPNDISLLTAGTLGKDISFYGSVVLAGAGSHGAAGGHGGGEERSLSPDLERVFVQFSNLFAWSTEEDDEGFRLAPRWLALPRHALNLRVGQFEPQVVAPWRSIHRQLGTTAYLPNISSVGGNGFTLEPAQRGLELHGTIRQNFSYAMGLVNGNGAESAWDNNSQKDIYFRVAKKWWGYPLDGEIGQVEYVNEDDGMVDSPGEGETAPIGLDFWREMQFETGFFGYFGRNEASVTVEDNVDLALAGNAGTFTLAGTRTVIRPDRFERIGFDARMQIHDFDIFGAWIYGWDSDPISDEEPDDVLKEELSTWFVESNYYFKPWLIGYCRYEELGFKSDERDAEAGMKRAVTGTSMYVRANMRVVSEIVIDARGNGTQGDTFNALLDFAY